MFQVHNSVLVQVGDLNPAAYNPRKIAPSKFEALKDSIRHDGFLDPIVVQKKGMCIIGGHQRVRAVKEICVEDGLRMPKIPAIVLDVDDRAAKRLNIKLNNIRGEFDARLLGELLIDIYPDDEIQKADVSALGFEVDEAMKYVHLIEPPVVPPAESVSDFGRSITISLEFGSLKLRDQVKKIIQERVKVERKRSGEIIAEFLLPKKKKARAA